MVEYKNKEHLIAGISSIGRLIPQINGVPFIASKASGAYVWDKNGKKYIDTLFGFGANLLGHSPPYVANAVNDAFLNGSMPGYANVLEEKAAMAITSKTRLLNKLTFVNSGSEAVHLACKIALTYTGKKRILKIKGCYHGWLLNYADSFDTGYFELLDLNDCQQLYDVFEKFDDIAAILLEPVLANSGCLVPDQHYLQAIREVAKDNDVLVISDEVLMGYRIKNGLTSHVLGIDPDIVTIGKAIGSGFPVAAVLGKERVMSIFENGKMSTAGTYNGNPLACAAVISTSTELDKKDHIGLLKKGNDLRKKIETAASQKNFSLITSGYGSVFSLWYTNKIPSQYLEAQKYANRELSLNMHLLLRERGVLISPEPFGRIFLSFSHSQEDVDTIAQKIFECIDEMKKTT